MVNLLELGMCKMLSSLSTTSKRVKVLVGEDCKIVSKNSTLSSFRVFGCSFSPFIFGAN